MNLASVQQALDRIKQATNILVTVSNNPSVDQLASCIGMTLLLNRVDKHATAVFSGKVPSTIEFLQPDKTIETNTDSLRDFIISLDKDKADKLRYKVEDQFVRIFITPYRTSISQKDLVFSQGDFNVEVVLALGVENRTEFDAAITAHGRILHDATVISIVAGDKKAPDIGQINIQNKQASSLCEMLVNLSDGLGTNLLDNQMATAFLTGIVAETDRFSNAKTTPQAMSVSAKLMAAGANQQLIISKLEPPPPPTSGGGFPPPKKPPEPPKQPGPGVLSVSHQPEVADTDEVEVTAGDIHIDEHGNITPHAQNQNPAAQMQLPSQQPIPQPVLPPQYQQVLTPQQMAVPQQPMSMPMVQQVLPPLPQTAQPMVQTPTIAQTMVQPNQQMQPMVQMPTQPQTPQIIKTGESALPETPAFQPADRPAEGEGEVPGPHELLNPTERQPAISSPFTADTQPGWFDPSKINSSDPLGMSSSEGGTILQPPKVISPPSNAVIAGPPIDSARSAVQNALQAVPFDPSGQPLVGLGAAPLAADLHPQQAPQAQPIAQMASAPQPPPPPVPPPLMPAMAAQMQQPVVTPGGKI